MPPRLTMQMAMANVSRLTPRAFIRCPLITGPTQKPMLYLSTPLVNSGSGRAWWRSLSRAGAVLVDERAADDRVERPLENHSGEEANPGARARTGRPVGMMTARPSRPR